jgi:hypothetical protein
MEFNDLTPTEQRNVKLFEIEHSKMLLKGLFTTAQQAITSQTDLQPDSYLFIDRLQDVCFEYFASVRLEAMKRINPAEPEDVLKSLSEVCEKYQNIAVPNRTP